MGAESSYHRFGMDYTDKKSTGVDTDKVPPAAQSSEPPPPTTIPTVNEKEAAQSSEPSPTTTAIPLVDIKEALHQQQPFVPEGIDRKNFFRPFGIATDLKHIFVTSYRLKVCRLWIFDLDGKLICSLLDSGSADKETQKQIGTVKVYEQLLCLITNSEVVCYDLTKWSFKFSPSDRPESKMSFALPRTTTSTTDGGGASNIGGVSLQVDRVDAQLYLYFTMAERDCIYRYTFDHEGKGREVSVFDVRKDNKNSCEERLFCSPRGMAIQGKTLYVCLRDRHRIALLDKVTGAGLGYLTVAGLYYPRDVLLFRDVMYICDAHRVHRIRNERRKEENKLGGEPETATKVGHATLEPFRLVPYKRESGSSDVYAHAVSLNSYAHANSLCVNPAKKILYVTHSDSVEMFDL